MNLRSIEILYINIIYISFNQKSLFSIFLRSYLIFSKKYCFQFLTLQADFISNWMLIDKKNMY